MADTRDVFISYARPREEEAHRIAQSLREKGFGVWRDDDCRRIALTPTSLRSG